MKTFCGIILAWVLSLGANAAAAGGPYGACAHITRDEPPARTCAMMRQAGMGWVRSDFDWRSIERKKGEWDFSHFDNVVSACEAEGMQLLPILGYSVPWASPAHEHLDAWDEYVRRVVGRYGRRLPVVEVWNEENLSGFWHNANPTNYLALLRRTYETVKRVDPSVRVAFGGTSGVPFPFIEEVYKLGGAKYFDIMNIHPYSHPERPEGSLDTNIEKLRAMMAKYGDAEKPLWITEIGWPTHDINIDGELLLAGLKAARPGLDKWRVLYLHASDGDDGSYTDQLVRQKLLKTLPAGSQVESCCSAKTAERLAKGDVDAVVYPFTEQYPADSFGAVHSFVRDGGVLVEFGGMPMWTAYGANDEGRMVHDKRHDSGRDRQCLRLSEMAYWMDKRYPESLRVLPTAAAAGVNVPEKGLVGKRFLTPRLLKEGDKFIPLLIARTNGVDAVAAAVYKFDSDMKGAVVVNALIGNGVVGTSSEARQADMTARALGIAFAEGVENFFLYEFRQVDHDPYDPESYFGIVHDNFAPKPAYGAYMTFVGARPAGSVQKGGAWCSEDGKVYYPQWTIPGKGGAGMIWTCGVAKDMAVAFSSDRMTFLDVAGARVRPARAGKVYTLPVSGSPIYFFGGELFSMEK